VIEERLIFAITTIAHRYGDTQAKAAKDEIEKLWKHIFKTFDEALTLALTSQDKTDDELRVEQQELISRFFEGLGIPQMLENAVKDPEAASLSSNNTSAIELNIIPETAAVDGREQIPEALALAVPQLDTRNTAATEERPALEATGTHGSKVVSVSTGAPEEGSTQEAAEIPVLQVVAGNEV
jgi:hypothetical protein